jgi:hypothetical protein
MCGLDVHRPTEKLILRITRQLAAELIWIVSSVDQTYVAWSRRWIRVEILVWFFR